MREILDALKYLDSGPTVNPFDYVRLRCGGLADWSVQGMIGWVQYRVYRELEFLYRKKTARAFKTSLFHAMPHADSFVSVFNVWSTHTHTHQHFCSVVMYVSCLEPETDIQTGIFVIAGGPLTHPLPEWLTPKALHEFFHRRGLHIIIPTVRIGTWCVQ